MDNDIQAGPLTSIPRSPLQSPRIRLSLTENMQRDAAHDQVATDSIPNDSHSLQRRQVNEWKVLSEFHPGTAPKRHLPANNEWNCEVLDDVLTLRWTLQGNFIFITVSVHVSALPDRVASYIAIGFGGPKTKSQMIGSDVSSVHLPLNLIQKHILVFFCFAFTGHFGVFDAGGHYIGRYGFRWK